MQRAQVWPWVMLSARSLVLRQTLHPGRVMHSSFRGSYVQRANDRTAAEAGFSTTNSTGNNRCEAVSRELRESDARFRPKTGQPTTAMP